MPDASRRFRRRVDRIGYY
ncbi:hypothetical protein VTL71DRAFT_15715 [Oculimacula yallundae]|uniref:Uncharacterized protein n=1 Tax=Oculimacula yallundae TaxID=86028 RepID=A0ABR4CCH2_9HELO